MVRKSKNITWIKGNILYSDCQTITVPVNTVGVMGKGLALSVKQRFPEVFEFYRKACCLKQIRIGQPCVYRGASKWFLLFPTKRHWRELSSLQDIEQGLDWILRNYSSENITSLAVPALGCGLGGLNWKEVGSIMEKFLSQIPIPVSIYLPHVRELTRRQPQQEL